MINKTNCLRFQKGGVDRALYTIEWSDYVWNNYQAGIGFQLNGKNFYVPAREGTASNTICFQKNGKNYYCFNDYPRLTFYFSHSPIKDRYDNIVAYTKTLTEVRLSYAIKTALDIFINNGTGGWEKAGTISAGSVQIKPSYSVTRSMAYSQAAPGHRINLRAQTQQGVETITGSVTWTVDTINWGTGSNITGSVKLDKAINNGYIDVTGHWYGYIPNIFLIPIWTETTGTSTVMSAKASEGSATRWFANISSEKYRMRLVYHSGNSEFGDRTICDRSWSWSYGNANKFYNAMKNFPVTDRLSFETLGSNRETVVEGSVGMTDTASPSYEIPSKWY